MLCLPQNLQKPPHYTIWILKTLAGIEMLNHKYPMITKEAISLMILYSARWGMKWLAIHLKNSPLALIANHEIRFSITPTFWRTEPDFTVWKKENTRAIECLCDSNLTF